MKKEDIELIIKNKENQEVEFKQGCPANHEISQIICAFANTYGRFFIMGISERGQIKGVLCDLDKLQVFYIMLKKLRPDFVYRKEKL